MNDRNTIQHTFTLPHWLQPSFLQGMQRGIERESLRMQSNGFLSQLPHPKALGAALTHSCITTDYSEALLEFITPPQPTIHAALEYLTNIHLFVHQHLPAGESLWPLSMPCMLDQNDENIPLAAYGTSNIGRFKTLYRHGLGIRYGRRMQTISGVHYNLSFPDELFAQLQQHDTQPHLKHLSLQEYRSQRYFALIRNFIRLTPMVIYLLGASPTVCRCFVTGRQHHLQMLNNHTLYLPHATALRMGHLGYQNTAQRQLGIHYNDLTGYLQGIRQAIGTAFPAFKALGLDNQDGEPIQINDHILQIENEYYSLIRPKQPPQGEETPAQALEARGVAYVELRAVDVDPFSPIGISSESAAFLEILALYCLLLDSAEITDEEQTLIDQNQEHTVNHGRDRTCQIQVLAQDSTIQSIKLQDWIAQHLTQMENLAQYLDQANAQPSTLYTDAWNTMRQRCADSSKTLSAQILAQSQQGAWHFGAALAQQHQQFYQQHTLDSEIEQFFIHEAQQSLQRQQHLEQQTQISFHDYLIPYRQ